MSSTEILLNNNQLNTAFEERQFHLVYQPQIATDGARVSGAEAYVRWMHPEFGAISPALFLKFVDLQGRSRELTNYLIRLGLKTAAKWHYAGLEWPVSLNVGVDDLVDGTMPMTLDILLRENEIDANQVNLDIPEGELVHEWDAKWGKVSKTLKELRDMGVSVSLECRGPHRLDHEQIDRDYFDAIKVSGPTLLQFANNTHNLTFSLISKRMRFAKDNDFKTVAVGAEDNAALLVLKKIGFDYIQGHIISPPVALDKLTDWRRTYVPPAMYVNPDKPVEDWKSPASEVEIAPLETADETAESVLDGQWSRAASGETLDEVTLTPEATPSQDEEENAKGWRKALKIGRK